MKLSSYNIFVKKNDIVICFNSLSNTFIAINKSSYTNFLENKKDINNLKKGKPQLFNNLLTNGFIIDDKKDELNIIRLRNKENSFNKHSDLVVLPTLDCNLKCWYCWESHIPNSKMGEETQEAIYEYVKKELGYGNIDSLNLEFFGGEPLLHFDDIVFPLAIKIKDLLEKNNKTFVSTFITNGSLITDKTVDKLALLNPLFQITLDGSKQKHDKVRFRKADNGGTYKEIIKALYLITERIQNARINIRINFDNKTLENPEELVRDLNNLNREKVFIHLERVWQTKSNKVEKQKKEVLEQAISLLLSNNFIVDYGNFQSKLFSCKSDRYRILAINYNGDVYKCTGRPFTKENRQGVLLNDGSVDWDYNNIANRLGSATYENEKCLQCKILPLCMGPCSQKNVENNWGDISNICLLNNYEFSINEFVITHFNNTYLEQKVTSQL